MVIKSFMIEFVVASSETVVSKAFMCIIAGILCVLKWILEWSVPSRALAGGFKQCSTFTSQFITLKGSHFA